MVRAAPRGLCRGSEVLALRLGSGEEGLSWGLGLVRRLRAHAGGLAGIKPEASGRWRGAEGTCVTESGSGPDAEPAAGSLLGVG